MNTSSVFFASDKNIVNIINIEIEPRELSEKILNIDEIFTFSCRISCILKRKTIVKGTKMINGEGSGIDQQLLWLINIGADGTTSRLLACVKRTSLIISKILLNVGL